MVKDYSSSMRFDVDDDSEVTRADTSGLDVMVSEDDVVSFEANPPETAVSSETPAPSSQNAAETQYIDRVGELDKTLVYEPVPDNGPNHSPSNGDYKLWTASDDTVNMGKGVSPQVPSSSKSNNYISSAPGPKRKKKHYFLKFLGILLVLGLVFAAFNVVSTMVRTEDQWRTDYNGTWQVKAIGNSSHPVTTLGASLFASSTTDLGKNMSIGIKGPVAQTNLLGVYSEYIFTFDKEHFRMMTKEGSLAFEGDYRFGFLVITEPSSGTVTVYERKAPDYEPVNIEEASQQPPDAESLLNSARELSGALGGVGQEILDNMSVADVEEALADPAVRELLETANPQDLQAVIGALDPAALASGDLNGAVDMSNPAVAKLVEKARESGVDIPPEVDALLSNSSASPKNESEEQAE